MVRKSRLFSAALLALGGLSASATWAGTISVDVDTSAAGIQNGIDAPRNVQRSDSVQIALFFEPATGEEIFGIDAELVYPASVLTITGTSSNTRCPVPTTQGRMAFIFSAGLDPLTAGQICTVTFSVAADAPFADVALALENFSSGQSGAPGRLTVSEGDPNVLLQFDPNFGGAAIELPGNVAGAVVNTAISVEAQGTIGSGSVSGCSISGAGASAFGPAPGDITVNAGATGTLPLSCTLPASQVATAQLQCTETDSDSAGVSRTWQLRCPVGTVVPVDPAITPATAAGAFGMPAGAIGQTVSRTLQFTPSGGAGSGSSTVTCTPAGGSPVTVTPATLTFTGSTTTPQSFTVRIPLTDADQGPFDLTCAINDSGADRDVIYSVTAAAGAAIVAPTPTTVPASSTWSQLLLIALMAGLGLAFVGFRRQS